MRKILLLGLLTLAPVSAMAEPPSQEQLNTCYQALRDFMAGLSSHLDDVAQVHAPGFQQEIRDTQANIAEAQQNGPANCRQYGTIFAPQ